MKTLNVILIAAGLAMTASSQTLPTYMMVALAANQYGTPRINGVVSGITPVSSQIGLYTSATADVTPIKKVDAQGRVTYLLGTSMRAGIHKVVYNGTSNVILLGGDVGASFNSTAAPATGLQISPTGSFTITYVHQLTKHWAIGVPIRMLWITGAGPGGSGAFNPVIQIGPIWKP